MNTKARFILLALMPVILAGCSSNCPFEVGDRAVSRTTEKAGVVADIGSGSMVESCSIAVIHDDGTLSQSDSPYGDGDHDTSREYVRAWKYKRAQGI